MADAPVCAGLFRQVMSVVMPMPRQAVAPAPAASVRRSVPRCRRESAAIDRLRCAAFPMRHHTAGAACVRDAASASHAATSVLVSHYVRLVGRLPAAGGKRLVLRVPPHVPTRAASTGVARRRHCAAKLRDRVAWACPESSIIDSRRIKRFLASSKDFF